MRIFQLVRHIAVSLVIGASVLFGGIAAAADQTLSPMLDNGRPVNWWFVFKFNAATFPGCGESAEKTRQCPFGGTPQDYSSFSQQFVYASSENPTLQQGTGCVGTSELDPVGATFGNAYSGKAFYVVWNDQFYGDPAIKGCGNSCSSPWGHSKGMLAWDSTGAGFVMQVTTPSWSASGGSSHPRQSDGNTLGCIAGDNNIKVSQHFFALKLTKDDVIKVLQALQNASVVTDTSNAQIVNNGGPSEIQDLVKLLGKKSDSTAYTKERLSSGIQLISKSSGLHVPPWQMVSALLGSVPLRTATWWMSPAIPSTSSSTQIDCWDDGLGKPEGVDIGTSGQWQGIQFGLTGGPGTNFNHAKLGVSTSENDHYTIMGDLNQQGALTGNCKSSQNGRGGLFFVLDNEPLFQSVTKLLEGNTEPVPSSLLEFVSS